MHNLLFQTGNALPCLRKNALLLNKYEVYTKCMAEQGTSSCTPYIFREVSLEQQGFTVVDEDQLVHGRSQTNSSHTTNWECMYAGLLEDVLIRPRNSLHIYVVQSYLKVNHAIIFVR